MTFTLSSPQWNLRFCALLTSWRTRGAACRYGSCSSRRNCCVRWWKSPSSAREGSSTVTSRSLTPNVSFASIPMARHLRKNFTIVLQLVLQISPTGVLRACEHERGHFRNSRVKRAKAHRRGFPFNLEESASGYFIISTLLQFATSHIDSLIYAFFPKIFLYLEKRNMFN